MPDRRRARLAVGVVALALSVVGCGGGLGQQATAGDQKGYISGDGRVTVVAPGERQGAVTLTGESTAGGEVRVADWRGDVIVVNLWYAGCAPCRAEAPDLAAAAASNASVGVRFVGLNVRDDVPTARAFERTFAVPYPSILDAGSGENVLALAGLVSPQSIPTTLVLDAQGRVAARVLGQVEPGILQDLIDDAVEEDGQAERRAPVEGAPLDATDDGR